MQAPQKAKKKDKTAKKKKKGKTRRTLSSDVDL